MSPGVFAQLALQDEIDVVKTRLARRDLVISPVESHYPPFRWTSSRPLRLSYPPWGSFFKLHGSLAITT